MLVGVSSWFEAPEIPFGIRLDARMTPHERVLSHVESLIKKAKPSDFNHGTRFKEVAAVNKANQLGRNAEQRTKSDLERTGKYLAPKPTAHDQMPSMHNEMRYIHGKLAKEHEAAAKAHEKAAAALTVANISDLAFNATFQAHRGEGDHFEAARLHGLAAEAIENAGPSGATGVNVPMQTSARYHRELQQEHLLLSGHGSGNPGEEGLKVARQTNGEVYQQQIDHELAAAEHHHKMAEAHKEESKKEVPVYSNSEWDEAKHPRDAEGKFT